MNRMVKLESVHGGHNNVAPGVRKGNYKEEVLANSLAKRVAELTGARFIPQDKGNVNQNLAYFVREMDKKRGANLSIHFNGFNTKATGTESFSYRGDKVGIAISTNMSRKVSQLLGIVNRGNKHTPLYVIDRSIDVTTLLEVCFLDNDSDMRKYISKVEEVAHAIASCYDNYKGKNGGTPVNKANSNYYGTGNYFVALKDLETRNKDWTKVDKTWLFKKGSKFAVRNKIITKSGSVHAQVAGLTDTYVTLAKSHVKPQ